MSAAMEHEFEEGEVAGPKDDADESGNYPEPPMASVVVGIANGKPEGDPRASGLCGAANGDPMPAS